MKTDTYWIGVGAVLLAGAVIMVSFTGVIMAVFTGCATTQHPDGTITTQMDIPAAQAALVMAQSLWQMYQDAHPEDTDSDEAEALQEKIEYWQGILARLLELRDAGVPKATVTVPVTELPVGGAK